MSASSPVPKDHPLMVAWEHYKATDDYANTKRWAGHTEHVDGSLWAAFEQGWRAAGGREPFAPAEPPQAPRPSGEPDGCPLCGGVVEDGACLTCRISDVALTDRPFGSGCHHCDEQGNDAWCWWCGRRGTGSRTCAIRRRAAMRASDLSVMVPANQGPRDEMVARALIWRVTGITAGHASELLTAPCLFCGYDGALYYQSGTHRQGCPWHRVGGARERSVLLRNELADVLSAAPRPSGEPASGSPLPLEHWRICSAGHDLDADCVCGLAWRIRLATEQEMHAAWRKRADEAESRPSGEREAETSDAPACKSCGSHSGPFGLAGNCVYCQRAEDHEQPEIASLRADLEAARAALAGLVQAWDSAPAEPTFNQALAAAERFGPAFAVARGVLAGSAPPTSEAPADLAALVREWQAAGEAYGAAQTASEHKAAQRRLGRARSVLQWWPRHPREDMERWDDWYQVAATPTDAPAPVQAEMPAIEVGDWVLDDISTLPDVMRDADDVATWNRPDAKDDILEIRGIRHGQPFVWVRPTGQE